MILIKEKWRRIIFSTSVCPNNWELTTCDGLF